jgi:hypothetical protein
VPPRFSIALDAEADSHQIRLLVVVLSSDATSVAAYYRSRRESKRRTPTRLIIRGSDGSGFLTQRLTSAARPLAGLVGWLRVHDPGYAALRAPRC